MRLTPDRSIALRAVRRDRSVVVLAALAAVGHVVEPGDRRLLVSACVGSAGCASSFVDTRVSARQLMVTHDERIHVSGCPKGCGAPVGVRHLVADRAGWTSAVEAAR